MERTVVAVFDSQQEAQAAWQDVVACGVDQQHVHLQQGSIDEVPGAKVAEEAIRRAGWNDSMDSEHDSQYREALRRGSYLVAVDPISADKAVDVAAALSRHNPINLDDRAAGWRERGWQGYNPSAPRMSDDELRAERDHDARRLAPLAADAAAPPAETGAAGATAGGAGAGAPDTGNVRRVAGANDATTIPVVEEELAVGKRVVQRGGVRIYTRVTEKPVEQSVTLREERAHVERRDVDRRASAADLGAAFKEGAIEITETAEEPVVSKEARVVGEVDVGKDVTERTQTVRDTVRRSDVEVEDVPATRPSPGDTQTPRTTGRGRS